MVTAKGCWIAILIFATSSLVAGCAGMTSLTDISAGVEFDKGNALGREHRYNEAVGAFQKAIQLKSDYVEAYYNLGITLLQPPLNRYDEAIVALQKAAQLKPDYAEAYYYIGVAKQAQNRHDEAIEPYQKAIQLRPDYAQAYHGLGIALSYNCKYADALAALMKYLSMAPSMSDQSSLIPTVERLVKELEGELAGKPRAVAGTPIIWDKSIAWKNWDEGLSLARKSQKPICLFVYTNWCPHCREMANSLKDREIVNLSQKFVMIKQDQDKKPAWLRETFCKYGTYIPRFFFLSPEGTVLAEITSGNQSPYHYSEKNLEPLKSNMRKLVVMPGRTTSSPPNVTSNKTSQ